MTNDQHCALQEANHVYRRPPTPARFYFVCLAISALGTWAAIALVGAL